MAVLRSCVASVNDVTTGVAIMTKQTQESLNGYWCVICQRFIEADEYGVIVHDDINHSDMMFDEEERPQ